MAEKQPTLNAVEEWLPVVGFEGLYEVSSHGNVRSRDRNIVGSNGVKQRFSGRLMVLQSNGSHFYVKLRSGNQRRVARYAHRLVMESFVGPCPDGMEVRHLDGDPSNNRLENLRYGSVSENRYDSVRHGTHVETRKTHCPRGHALKDPNIVRSSKLRGRRNCLACSRARAHVRRKGTLDHFQEISDSYYRKIIN